MLILWSSDNCYMAMLLIDRVAIETVWIFTVINAAGGAVVVDDDVFVVHLEYRK